MKAITDNNFIIKLKVMLDNVKVDNIKFYAKIQM